MEKLAVKAFKKYCRETLPSGAKPTAQDAVDFFVTLGATGRDDWSTFHRALTQAGLI